MLTVKMDDIKKQRRGQCSWSRRSDISVLGKHAFQ